MRNNTGCTCRHDSLARCIIGTERIRRAAKKVVHSDKSVGPRNCNETWDNLEMGLMTTNWIVKDWHDS